MDMRLRTALRYVVPSIGGMLALMLYIVVDGIFVGQGIGKDALAAVNIVLPFTLLLTALVAMVTVGGATVTAIRLGRGEPAGANQAFMTSVCLSGAIALAVMLTGVLAPVWVARTSGATDALLTMTVDYIRFFSLFALANGLSYCLCVFVRNDGDPRLAFWSMVSGAVTNVFFDWLFVFPLQLGIMGAAIATGIGQVLSCGLLLTHFCRKQGQLRLRWEKCSLRLVGKVMRRGLPEMVTQLNTPVTVLCYNLVILQVLGEIGVSAYSVLGYITSLMFAVFFGVSEGLQPLIGQSFGAGRREDTRYFLKLGAALNLGLSALLYGLLLLGGRGLIAVFNGDAQLIDIAYNALRIYGLSFVVGSVNIQLNTYFFCTKRTGRALVISVCRSLVLNVVCIFGVPVLLGEGALWYSILFAEGLTLLVGGALKLCEGRGACGAPRMSK